MKQDIIAGGFATNDANASTTDNNAISQQKEFQRD